MDHDHERLLKLAADAVGAAQRQLPPTIRPLARKVPVLYERVPDASLLANGVAKDTLGLFTGHSHGSELDVDQIGPPEFLQIILYLENLWRFSEGDQDIFREEVRITYLHELGHYLRWDEDDIAARGLD